MATVERSPDGIPIITLTEADLASATEPPALTAALDQLAATAIERLTNR
jgi:hypothetical protein